MSRLIVLCKQLSHTNSIGQVVCPATAFAISFGAYPEVIADEAVDALGDHS